MKKIELLSPAGSMDSLYAAVQNGADAVYFGGDKFSARAFAGNFDKNDLIHAIDYCHLYGVKAYLALNTLIKECEFYEVRDYLEFLYLNGVDALIIQDLGVAEVVKNYLPNFEIHASTQMTVHNSEGAKLLVDEGFKRIVLSRELSLREIEHISKDLNIETEVFVHGALCVCYSGQCLMSSIIGGRSGNRGRCAQPCRLPYSLINEENEKRNGFILSPKDICLIDEIDKIIKSGTSSLKIEGRMKRPEYVAGVTSIYRQIIDDTYIGEKDEEKIAFLKKKLLQLFNREGFSKSYFFGNTGSSMMAYNNPKNTGISLGSINNDGELLLLEDVRVNDGISFGSDGAAISKIIKNGIEVNKGNKGDKVKIFPKINTNNHLIYKTQDVELLKSYKESFSDIYRKKIELNCNVQFEINKPIFISVTYMGKEFKVSGEMVQKPIKAPVTMEKLINNIKKTGNTPFIINKIDFIKFDSGFLPISSINDTRRKLIEDITNFVISKSKREIEKANVNKAENSREILMPDTLLSISNEEQLKAVMESGYKSIAVNPFLRNNVFREAIRNTDLDIYIKVPNIIKEEFENVCSIIDTNRENIKGILTGNLGIFNRYRGIIPIIGDYKVNVCNKLSWQYYSKIIEGGYISAELNKKELKDIFYKNNIPLGILIYGNIELMVSEYCAIGALFGGKCEDKSCNGACKKSTYILRDRKNEDFKIQTDDFCRSYIYNSVPLNLIPNMEEIKNIGINYYRLDFTFESQEETEKILNCYRDKKWMQGFSGYTRGHFKRGVE